ncbi:hypothetical protein [Pseudomonas quasicaspiana]|uniref:hypothetical protein n=1 Tax=Pseudomonas quasicaspiana TaxID=2829821 RepID=UPI001E438A6D|nr:hypothetical protein [Pseudomonas quasicaspiana]MCD5972147.1 hypothetical protein [Pseudomonas quasicaspiana]
MIKIPRELSGSLVLGRVLLLAACKQENSPEKASLGFTDQAQNLGEVATKAVSHAESSEDIRHEQKRTAREQDQLLENALSGEAQQRGELAKSVQLCVFYVRCVKNSKDQKRAFKLIREAVVMRHLLPQIVSIGARRIASKNQNSQI